MKNFIGLLAVWILIASPSVGLGETITIATFDWCPLICPQDDEYPGILVEYSQAIYNNLGYTVNFVPYPWSRAILETRNGTTDALLAPVKRETPDFIFPETAIGTQRFCFFKRKGDPWEYRNSDSVTGRKILYPQSAEGALPKDLLTAKLKAKRFDSRAQNELYMEGTIKQLQYDRYDLLLMTYYAMADYLFKNDLTNQVEVAGCPTNTPIYLAFSPHPSKQGRVQHLISLFEKEVEKVKMTVFLNHFS